MKTIKLPDDSPVGKQFRCSQCTTVVLIESMKDVSWSRVLQAYRFDCPYCHYEATANDVWQVQPDQDDAQEGDGEGQ